MLNHLIDAFRLPARLALWLLALLVLTLIGFAAHAENAVLTWALPTEYEDGTPLPVADLRETVAQWLVCDGTWPAQGTPSALSVPAPTETAIASNLGVGTWCFRVAVVSQLGGQSDWSNVAVKTIGPPPKPKPVRLEVDIQTIGTIETLPDGGLRLVVR